MMSKVVAFALIALFLGEVIEQGTSMLVPKYRCLCARNVNRIKTKQIAKLEVFPKTAYCTNIEIIATLKKTGKKRCLNPNSLQGKTIITRISRVSN
nr:PREDICTED: C-X-C motif chemokine 10-like [Latimeria chalumnae]|eukprot:XP_006003782.1 PREDICTED: C-X-C motif chemokine 10-like [Latimeria chalumnae]